MYVYKGIQGYTRVDKGLMSVGEFTGLILSHFLKKITEKETEERGGSYDKENLDFHLTFSRQRLHNKNYFLYSSSTFHRKRLLLSLF